MASGQETRDCGGVKSLGEVRSWAAGQDSLDIAWQVAGRLRDWVQGVPRPVQLPSTTSSLALGKCELGAIEFVLVLGSGGCVIHPC